MAGHGEPIDGRHSVPTELGVTVDGATQTFSLPPVPPSSGPGTTTRVVLEPDRPWEGRELTVDALSLVAPQFVAAPPAAAGLAAPEVVRADPPLRDGGRGGRPVLGATGPEREPRLGGDRALARRLDRPGPRPPLDAFASGWAMERGTDGRAACRFTWPPQRSVDLALAASGIGLLACIALVLLRPRRGGGLDNRSPTPVIAAEPLAAGRPLMAVSTIVVLAGASSSRTSSSSSGFSRSRSSSAPTATRTSGPTGTIVQWSDPPVTGSEGTKIPSAPGHKTFVPPTPV